MLLTYGYRHSPYGIRARLLDAEARDPGGAEELLLRTDGAGPDLGYPWAVSLPNGEVLVAYYWVNERQERVIVGTQIAL